MTERPLAELMRETPLPDSEAAEERTWRVVRAAAVERRAPGPRRRAKAPLYAAAAVLVAALALSPAGAAVADWLQAAVKPGRPEARPSLTSLPAPGRLLVVSADGAWLVRPDGFRRRLGAYDDARWSPRGLFVVATRGRELVALEPGGVERWSLARSRAGPFAGVVARRLPDRLSERPLAACRGGGWLGRPPASGPRRGDSSGMAARVGAQAHLCRSPRADRHGRPGQRPPALAIPARPTCPSARLVGRRAAARGADGRLAAHPVAARTAARRAPVRRGRACHRDGGRAVRRLGRGRGPRQRRAQPDRLGPAARGAPASPAPVRGRRQLHRPELVAGRALAAPRLARGRPMGVPALRQVRKLDAVAGITRHFDPGASGPLTFPRIGGWCCAG